MDAFNCALCKLSHIVDCDETSVHLRKFFRQGDSCGSVSVSHRDSASHVEHDLTCGSALAQGLKGVGHMAQIKAMGNVGSNLPFRKPA